MLIHRFILGVSAVALLATAGCGACDDKPKLLKPCEWGETQTCRCDGQARGTQMCSEDGNYERCECPDAVDMGFPPLEDVGSVVTPGCIMVEPERVDFGAVSVLGTTTRQVSVLNCAFLHPLVLETVQTCAAGTADDVCEPSTVFGAQTQSGAGTVTIQPLQTIDLNVTFTPTELEAYAGRLDVVGDGGARQSVDLSGEGDSCPQPVAKARLVDAQDWSDGIATIPLSTVEFSAADSIAPGGVLGPVEWTLVQRPANSTTTLLPGPDAAEPTLFLDLAGNYIVELRVFDVGTGESCGDPAQVLISASPDQEIHIQLVWDTPSDEDQTDGSGTDVDLHFLHPMGTWNSAPYDIYWANKTSDWGAPGPDDDPSLDIDDVDGAGPENINMSGAEADATYQIGVYYFAARDFGVSNATVRVYIRGIQQFEALDVPLADTDAFWLVANLEAPALNIVEVGEVIQGFPPQP